MTISAEAGTLTSPAATGTQSYSHSLGVAPKAIIIWTTQQTADGVTGDGLFGIGFGTSATNRGAIATNYRDGGSDLTEDRRHDASLVILTLSNAGVVTEEADLDSFSATTFTLDWETVAAGAIQYHYILLAGDDLEANVVAFQSQTADATNQDVAHGLSGAPTGVLAISAHNQGASGTNDGAAEAGMTIGGTDATDDRVSSTWAAFGFGGTRYQIDDFLAHAQAVVAIERATVAAVDATNITLNWSIADTAEWYYLLCLRGCGMKVGTFSSTSTSVAVSTGLGQVAAFLAWGAMAADSSSNESDARLTFGASDGTNNVSAGLMISSDDLNSDRCNSSSKCLQSYDHAQALQEDGSAAISAGVVTVTFSAASSFEYHYLAIEATADAPDQIYFSSDDNSQRVEVIAWKDIR